MDWAWVVQGLLPLIIFVIVDTFAGLKWGVVAALVVAVAECIWDYSQLGHVETITLVSFGLVAFLGLVSVKLNDSRFFKFQPVVVGVLLALFIAHRQFFGVPLLVQLYPKMRKLMPPVVVAMYDGPMGQRILTVFSAALIFVLLTHALLVAIAALRKGNLAWILVRGIGLWVLMAIAAVAVRFFI